MNDSVDNTANDLVSESESSEVRKITTDETKQLNRLEVVDIDTTCLLYTSDAADE